MQPPTKSPEETLQGRSNSRTVKTYNGGPVMREGQLPHHSHCCRQVPEPGDDLARILVARSLGISQNAVLQRVAAELGWFSADSQHKDPRPIRSRVS